MKRLLTTAGVAALVAGTASAGGIERSTQSVAILFEQGRYAELTIGHVSPDVSGTFSGVVGSGDVLGSYTTVSLSYKMPIGERMDFALVLDQPIGADTSYPTGTGYPLAGTTATIDSNAITGMLRYKLENNFSVYGGVRVIRTSGDVNILFPAGFGQYKMSTSTETDVGYLVGVAYERPDIALRVALTYNSAVDHDLTGTEKLGPLPTTISDFTTTIPQSLNLEFQTGIMKDTLLFGSVRWVDWSEFDINPTTYRTYVGEKLVEYAEDSTTWTLGVGRKFSDQWSGSVMASYEDRHGGPSGNLSPVNGSKSIGVGVTYTMANMKISGALHYIDIGDATSKTIGGQFSDNSGIAGGIRIGYYF